MPFKAFLELLSNNKTPVSIILSVLLLLGASVNVRLPADVKAEEALRKFNELHEKQDEEREAREAQLQELQEAQNLYHMQKELESLSFRMSYLLEQSQNIEQMANVLRRQLNAMERMRIDQNAKEFDLLRQRQMQLQRQISGE